MIYEKNETKLKLLTAKQAANELGISAATLAVWRCTKRYTLRYYKVGGRVRYRMWDIENFLASRTHAR